MKYICPVCGFKGLTEPAYDDQGNHSYEICSCCGFQFGFDDYEMMREDGSYLEPSESIIRLPKKLARCRCRYFFTRMLPAASAAG